MTLSNTDIWGNPIVHTPTPNELLNQSINQARSEAAGATGSVAGYGGQAINTAQTAVDTTQRYGTDAINTGKGAVNAVTKSGKDATKTAQGGVATAEKYGDIAMGTGQEAVNEARRYGDMAIGTGQEGVTEARRYGDTAIESGMSALEAILSGRGYVEDSTERMRELAETAGRTYDASEAEAYGMRPYIQGVMSDSERVRNMADALLPDAQTLREYGDSMWQSGTKVTEQALATLGTGMGFINLDSSASPLVKQALTLYGEFDPDAYAAKAEADTQAKFDNARGQMERDLARKGVQGGAAQAALMNQFARSLATARASARTLARERGIADRASMFQSLITKNALDFLGRGGELASIGSTAQSNAVGARDKAAGVVNSAGDLYGKAGGLVKDAGTMQGSLSSMLATIAEGRGSLSSIYKDISNLFTGYNKDLAGAYDSLANIQNSAGDNVLRALGNLGAIQNAAGGNVTSALGNLGTIQNTAGGNVTKAQEFLATTQRGVGNDLAATMGNLATLESGVGKDLATALGNLATTQRGVGNDIAGAKQRQAEITNATEQTRVNAVNHTGGGGTVTVGAAPSQGDDWMNWKNTGHSQTWNANNNPNYWDLVNNGQ